LRILGLLAILSSPTPTTVIGFEEPENGVHPRRLKLIADLLQNAAETKQVIVNTHSPTLPDYLQNAHLVRCARTDGHTLFETVEPLPLFRTSAIKQGLEEQPTPISERILRGDFDE
jgi:predicted ATPase